MILNNWRPAKDALELRKMYGFKASAYQDYVAARLLFNNNMLAQACVLSNTAIEKSIKLTLSVAGVEVRGHETTKLLNRLFEKRPEAKQNINKDYIKVLENTYVSRYFDDLPQGYNYVINKNKFLAELDFTFNYLDALSIAVIAGKTVPSTYAQAVLSKLPEIYERNYLLNGISKDYFLSTPDIVREFRLHRDGSYGGAAGFSQVMEYEIAENLPEHGFDLIGLEVVSEVNPQTGVFETKSSQKMLRMTKNEIMVI